MKICRISGSIHATIKDPPLEGKTLLMAQPLDLGGVPEGPPVVVVDTVGAGVGDMVLVMREGGSARIVLHDERVPVQALAVAIIDDVRLGG